MLKKGLSLILVLMFLFNVLNLTSFSVYARDNNNEKIDKYGQIESASFGGSVNKVTEDQQLMDDVSGDKAYYDSLKPPAWDKYGGLPGSKALHKLKATGYFHVQMLKDKRTVMVDPIGNIYYSSGVDGVGYVGDTYTQIKGRESTYQWLPKYTTDKNDPDSLYKSAFLGSADYFSFYMANKIKKTGKAMTSDELYNETASRIKKWGFNSEGGWSQTPAKNNTTNLPQVRFADLPSADMISDLGVLDVFKASVVKDIDKAFKNEKIAEHAKDTLIIGYFVGNEYQYDKIKGVIPQRQASKVASKKALVDMLKSKYKNIAAFNKAWETKFNNFNQMYEAKLGVTTDAAGIDMDNFLAMYLDKFYKTISTEFRKFDKNHMLMGDRYLANTIDVDSVRNAICKAAGKYLDLLSYNYYAYDPDLERLKSMHQISGRPIIITEFHYGEPSEGQTSAVKMMNNEKEKGLAYRNYVENVASTGFVVGTHWFEYLDESTTGRWFQGYNGENFAVGLVNTADRPYKDMLNSVMTTNYHIYDLVLGKQQPYHYKFSTDKVARNLSNVIEIPKAASKITIDGVKEDAWPKGMVINLDNNNLIVGTKKEGFSSQVNFAWDDSNLYVFAHMNDDTPRQNPNTGFDIWNGDALELFVGPENVDEKGSLKVKDTQIILSGGPADQKGTYQFYWYNNKPTQPKIDMMTKSDEDEKGYTIEAAIPFAGLNITNAAAGKNLRFDVGIDNGDTTQRTLQLMWNGAENNNSSRDKWGMAVFTTK